MRHIYIAAFAANVTLATASHAGDGNTINLLQISTGSVGNSLFIDQSDASNSSVSGDLNGLLPASQIGSGNTAAFEITGNGGSLALNQNNALSGLGLGNNAEGLISGLGFGSVQQLGTVNTARLDVLAPENSRPARGTIVQTGSLNDASLNVAGNGASGTLLQFGSNNVNTLTVEGTGTTVTFTQIGNGNSNATIPGTTPEGITVLSNGGSVAITQYSF